jgi:hypothetical protein
MPAATLFTEIFPVRADALPALHAYLPVYKGDAPRTGGKLAYRLRGALGGHWLWLDGRLVTDVAPNPVKTMMALDALKAAHGKTFGKLELLEQDLRWQATAEHIAEFVIRGPLDELQETIKTALAKITLPITHARIEREHKARAWGVGGLPAISLSVVSRLIYARSIMEYAATLAKPAELVGLTVADTTSTLQGDIIKVVGTVGEHRQRLIDLSQRAVMRKLIEAAPADSLVLRVESKGEQYDYAADALALVVTFETQRRFDVPPAQVERALQINPSLRAQLVKIAADIAKNSGLLDAAYSQQNAPDRFTVVLPKPSIVWGGDKARDFDREAMGADFTKHSAWRFEGDTIRILTINALDEDADLFVESLSRELSKTHGIPLEIVRERRVKVVSEENLDSAVRALAKEDAHALVAFFPDDPQGQDAASLHDDYLKRMTVARGLPSLVLHAGTLHRTEAMPQLIMGLLARAGGTPFAFEEPLPYADRIVGLAIHRVSKKDGDHLTALARLYSNRGAALGWRAARAVLRDGAGLAESVLEQLLPAREIATKRTILHIDGSLHPEDAAALAAWEEQHDAALYPVELIERGNPRLYAFADKKIELPARGSAFMLSEREALLAAAGAPWNATPQPLLVRNLAQMKMAQVLDSVMTMALLHHGAVGLPKLPVTLSYAAEWREGIERGLFPQQSAGKSLWWL